MCDRCAKLEDVILAIDAKATPYGSGIVENGENYATAYLIPAGPLHRALGVVGRSAQREYLKPIPPTSDRKSFPASAIGITLKQEPEPVKPPKGGKTHYFD